MEPGQTPTPQPQKSSTPYIIAAIVIIIVIAVIVIFASKKSNDSTDQVSNSTNQTDTTATDTATLTPTDTMDTTTPSTTPSGTPEVGLVKTFTVEGKNYSFSPSTITVNKGDTVKIVFSNTGGMHNWKVDEFNAESKTINDGQSDTIQFVADKSGSFEFYCGVSNHRAMGMKGTLIVK